MVRQAHHEDLILSLSKDEGFRALEPGRGS
jgi:hypothetical protein